mgnify:CR=1 FL=1
MPLHYCVVYLVSVYPNADQLDALVKNAFDIWRKEGTTGLMYYNTITTAISRRMGACIITVLAKKVLIIMVARKLKKRQREGTNR